MNRRRSVVLASPKAAAVRLLLCFAAVLVAGDAAAQVPAGSTRMVDVMGTPVRVLTLGLENREEGQPVLFLHSGAGSPLEAWGEWVSAISRLAPVVAYDRPGLGRSPFDDVAPTPERVVTHAHELMSVLEVAPPYILVGHSWGGPLILYYAARYPDEVVGMVYLDPTEPDLTPYQYLLASNEQEHASRRAELERVMAAMNLPPGMEAERRAIVEFQESAPGDRGLPEDPGVPTAIVLGALVTPPPPGGPSFVDETYLEEFMEQRLLRFAERVAGRPATTLLVATDAGHFVHRDAPELAEEAVRRVVAAADAERSASPSGVASTPAAERVEVEVGEEILATYVGEYELAPTFSIVVTLEDGALFIQATNQPRLPIFAESETEFFLRAVEARITFERDGDGAVTGLILHQGGRDVAGRKVRVGGRKARAGTGVGRAMKAGRRRRGPRASHRPPNRTLVPELRWA